MRFLLLLVALSGGLLAQGRHELTISGTRFMLDGKPFPFTGVSFFNAFQNPAFHKDRITWLKKFQSYNINVLRVWCQWDSKIGLIDTSPEATMYNTDGSLRAATLQRAKALVEDADSLGMVIQMALFSHESWRDNIRLEGAAADRAVASLAREMLPYRNVIFQIWNEHTDDRVLDHVKVIKAIDPKRIVTNSPGFASFLGDPPQNSALDYLSPHTSRQRAGPTWEIAPREIEYLLARYRKPVVDDEPARNGTPNMGGPPAPTSPYDHIVQIFLMWRAGAYVTYHHDMFQLGYGSPSIPPNGIPDPEFNPYHKQTFEFLRLRDRYAPWMTRP